MSDFERFTEFLLRASASYHAPPETPAEAMWAQVEAALETDPRQDLDPIEAAADAYHAPPIAPAEEMWERIEAAWSLRRTAPLGAREAGLDTLEPAFAPEPTPSRRPDRRAVGLWIGGLAAASLVIGIAIGRGTAPATGPAPRVASGTPQIEAPATGESDPGPAVRPEPDAPLETGAAFADADPEAPGRTPPEAGETGTPTGPGDAGTAARPNRRGAVARYATAEHLGRAETLLTAFRTDEGPALQGEMAGWARELLGETRLLLDMPVERAERETALLRELELVLAQIARLGPEDPAFERELIEEGIERQGTITRLRTAMPQAGT